MSELRQPSLAMDDCYYHDDDDYGLEYSEESTSEPDVDLENQYYIAKTLKEENPLSSLDAFQRVLDIQGEIKGQWGFKALKQIVKINFHLKRYDETMKRYKELLSYVNNAITKNHGEKSINSILDYTSNSRDFDILKDFYETTLNALKLAKNDRLWFKTNTKLGKVFLERGEFGKLAQIIKQLKQACKWSGDVPDIDSHKGTQLLEIYALEIQMYTEQKDNKKLKELYEQSLRIKSAIPHPLIMSIIRECGGKMHLRAGDFDNAYTDFFEAFKNYDESGNPRRITSLKYLVLTSMLLKSVINPFDSQEAKPYKNDPEIKTLTDLIAAFQNNDMKNFERIYQENKQKFMGDQFIEDHIFELLTHVRTEVLVLFIKPYKHIRLSTISTELGISKEETENLLVSCILSEKIVARIDQVKEILVTNSKIDDEKYVAMECVAERLDSISARVMNCFGGNANWI